MIASVAGARNTLYRQLCWALVSRGRRKSVEAAVGFNSRRRNRRSSVANK